MSERQEAYFVSFYYTFFEDCRQGSRNIVPIQKIINTHLPSFKGKGFNYLFDD